MKYAPLSFAPAIRDIILDEIVLGARMDLPLDRQRVLKRLVAAAKGHLGVAHSALLALYEAIGVNDFEPASLDDLPNERPFHAIQILRELKPGQTQVVTLPRKGQFRSPGFFEAVEDLKNLNFITVIKTRVSYAERDTIDDVWHISRPAKQGKNDQF